MRSILVVSVLAFAACDQNQNDRNDRTNAPGDRMPPPPGSPTDAAHPMGRPDMPPDHPPMGHDMGRGEMGRDGMFRIDPSDPNSAMVEELVATVSGDAAHKDIKGKVTFRMQGSSTRCCSLRAGTKIDTSGASLAVKRRLFVANRDLWRDRPRTVSTTITSQAKATNQSALISNVIFTLAQN